MTKAEIVKQIAAETGIEKNSVAAVVEGFMAQVKKAVIGQDKVELRGFGTFGRKRRAAKIARNIIKNTTMHVPAHDIPYFKPSKEFAVKIK